MQYCDICSSNFLLDITQTPYKCITCPDACAGDCNDDGCGNCQGGFFLTQITSKNKLNTKVKVCQKCSDECHTCELDAENCTSCPEYYKLDEEKKCKFAYFRLLYVGMVVIILVLILMIILIIKCICMEKPPERPTFGSILDKDPDLQSDHMKYKMDTIGARSIDNSYISVVEAVNDGPDEMDQSRYSQDILITQLLGPPDYLPVQHSDMGEMHTQEPESLNAKIT